MEFLAEIRWRPRIGDPTFMGWLTVWAYAGAAVLGLLAAKPSGTSGQRAGWNRVWLAVAAGMAFLCVNKQLDLQSLFTDLGRELFRALGAYERRRAFQRWFVLLVLAGSGVGGLWLIWRFRSFWARHRLLVAGLFFLLTFLVVRAISFHHVDQVLRFRIGGLKMNWFLELTGIGLVAAAALVERRSLQSRKESGQPV